MVSGGWLKNSPLLTMSESFGIFWFPLLPTSYGAEFASPVARKRWQNYKETPREPAVNAFNA